MNVQPPQPHKNVFFLKKMHVKKRERQNNYSGNSDTQIHLRALIHLLKAIAVDNTTGGRGESAGLLL